MADPDRTARLLDQVLALTKAFALCVARDEAAAIQNDVRMFASQRRLITDFVIHDGAQVATLCTITLIYTDGAYSPRLKFWKKDKRRGGSRSTLEYEIQEEQRTQVIKLTNELDAIYIAANLKGKNTENIRWWNVLQQQDVPNNIVRRMQMTANTAIALTRAKRAAAAIMWANGYPNGSA